MKTLKPLFKSLVILTVLVAPATLVEGKKELANKTNENEKTNTYYAADVIKKMIPYTAAAATTNTRMRDMQNLVRAIANKAEIKRFVHTAAFIYNEMGLADSGLCEQAFEYAWVGYAKLQKKGLLHNTNVLTVCDFSQSSSQERMYVIDVKNHKLLYRTFVAHGINSGDEFANSFSNSDESCKSSLGFYVTSSTYYGSNGLSLRINGLDRGFNDHAYRRNIVIHGASYVSLRILHKYGVMGTTFGCPAIPTEMTDQIIPTVKDGSCFFIYYPSKKYISQSTVLNG